MSEIKQVVTYSTPLPGREIALCDEHARTQETWALGPVQHGRHDGVCEMCRRSEAAAILGRDSAARAGRAGRGAAKRRGDSKHYQELAARRGLIEIYDLVDADGETAEGIDVRIYARPHGRYAVASPEGPAGSAQAGMRSYIDCGSIEEARRIVRERWPDAQLRR